MTEPLPVSVTAEWADRYFARRLYTDLWDGASEADRAKALSWSAALISAAFSWDAADCADETRLDRIRAIVCEEAIWLLARDPSETAPLFGVKKASAGPIAVTFESPLDAGTASNLIAPIAARMAADLVPPAGTRGTITSTMLP